jgi:hypothetical protein
MSAQQARDARASHANPISSIEKIPVFETAVNAARRPKARAAS